MSSQTPRAVGTISSPRDGGETESRCSSQACPSKAPLHSADSPGQHVGSPVEPCGGQRGPHLQWPRKMSQLSLSRGQVGRASPGREHGCADSLSAHPLPGRVALPGRVPGPWLSPHSLYQQLLDTKPLTRQAGLLSWASSAHSWAATVIKGPCGAGEMTRHQCLFINASCWRCLGGPFSTGRAGVCTPPPFPKCGAQGWTPVLSRRSGRGSACEILNKRQPLCASVPHL